MVSSPNALQKIKDRREMNRLVDYGSEFRQEIREVEQQRAALDDEKDRLLRGKTRFTTDKAIAKRKREIDNHIRDLEHKEEDIIRDYHDMEIKARKQQEAQKLGNVNVNNRYQQPKIKSAPANIGNNNNNNKLPWQKFQNFINTSSNKEMKYPPSALIFSLYMFIVGIITIYVGWQNNLKIKDCESAAMKNSNNLLMCMGAFICAVVLAYFIFTRNCGPLNPAFESKGYYIMSLLIGIVILVLNIIIMTEASSIQGCDVGSSPTITLVLSIIMIVGSSVLIYNTGLIRV
jgi:hypothetical protein